MKTVPRKGVDPAEGRKMGPGRVCGWKICDFPLQIQTRKGICKKRNLWFRTTAQMLGGATCEIWDFALKVTKANQMQNLWFCKNH